MTKVDKIEFSNVLDLADIASKTQNEARFEILHPSTGAGTGIYFTVHSPDSKEYRKFQSTVQNRNLQISRKNSNRLDMEQIAAGALDLLVWSVKGWENVQWSKTELECTETNVRMVFERLPWIKEQVDEFISRRANFLSE